MRKSLLSSLHAAATVLLSGHLDLSSSPPFGLLLSSDLVPLGSAGVRSECEAAMGSSGKVNDGDLPDGQQQRRI